MGKQAAAKRTRSGATFLLCLLFLLFFHAIVAIGFVSISVFAFAFAFSVVFFTRCISGPDLETPSPKQSQSSEVNDGIVSGIFLSLRFPDMIVHGLNIIFHIF